MQIACPACHTRYSVPDTAIGAAGREVRCAKCRHSWFQTGSDQAKEEAKGIAATPAESVQPVADVDHAPQGWAPHTAPTNAEPADAETVTASGVEEPAAAQGWHPHSASAAMHDDAELAVEDPPVATAASHPIHDEEIVEPEPVPGETHTSAFPPVEDAQYAHDEAIDAEYEELDRPARPWKKLALICVVLLIVAAAAVYGAVRAFGAPDWLPIGQSTFGPPAESLVLDFPLDDQDRRDLPNGRQLFAASGTITNTGTRTERVPPVLVVLRDSQERIVYSWEMMPPKDTIEPGESLRVSEMVTDVPRSAAMVDFGWKPS